MSSSRKTINELASMFQDHVNWLGRYGSVPRRMALRIVNVQAGEVLDRIPRLLALERVVRRISWQWMHEVWDVVTGMTCESPRECAGTRKPIPSGMVNTLGAKESSEFPDRCSKAPCAYSVPRPTSGRACQSRFPHVADRADGVRCSRCRHEDQPSSSCRTCEFFRSRSRGCQIWPRSLGLVLPRSQARPHHGRQCQPAQALVPCDWIAENHPCRTRRT